MKREILENLFLMRKECTFIMDHSEDMNFTDFTDNEIMKRAFSRSLEIIGETAKNIDSDFKNDHSGVDWASFIEVSEILTHTFDNVNYYVLWDMSKTRIPKLFREIDLMIEDIYSR
ncbi:MAG: DUF86 domain-containing protein [Thermoplasmatota archaeon]